MKQIKWFDRKFEFSFEQNIFPSIIERLECAPANLRHLIDQISAEKLITKIDEKWSIQENVGHLIDLEPLWQGRLEDILNDKEFLRPTDLENKKTDLARHNEKDINVLVAEFRNLREATINALKLLSEKEINKFALHPRLKTPMRTIDLFFFVAEHDDHHFAQIGHLFSK